MVYLSFGQTNGTRTSCSDAILLDHSQNLSTYLGLGETEIWFNFVADTTYMKFWLQDFPDSEIKLYSGACSNLQILDSNISTLNYNSLALGSTYYIQVENSNSNTYLYSLLSSGVECEIDCGTASNCNKITNGNFTQNDGSYGGVWNYTPQGLTYYWEAFSQGSALGGYFSHVLGWHSLWGTSDIIYDGSAGYVLAFRAGILPGGNGPGGAYPPNFSSESVVTCTELNQEYIYILNYKCRINDNANSYGLDLHWRITTEDIDDEIDPSTATYVTISDLPHDIETLPSQEISFEAVDYLIYQEHSEIFKPDQDYNRLYVFPEAWNISQSGSHWGLVDKVSITPIEYEDVTTCEPSITLEQDCASQINAVINPIMSGPNQTYTWTSVPANAITADANTLTPTVNTAGNPLLTLTVNYAGEILSTTVQVTNVPLQASFYESDDCDNNCTGFIHFTFVSGIAPYDYQITNTTTNDVDFNNTGFFDGLCVADYDLLVTDANGCTFTGLGIIKNSSLDILAESHNTYPSQECGYVEVTPQNGIAPFTYLWTDASGNAVGNTDVVGSLGGGTYTINISDANGCSTTESVSITSWNITLPEDEIIEVCEGATEIELGVPAAFDQYIWNTGDEGSAVNSIELNNVGLDIPEANPFGDYTVNMYNEGTGGACRLQKTFHVIPHEVDFDIEFNECSELQHQAGVAYPSLYYIYGTMDYTVHITKYENDLLVAQVPLNYMGDILKVETGVYNPDVYFEVHITGATNDGCNVDKLLTLYTYKYFGPDVAIAQNSSLVENEHFILGQDWNVNSNLTFIDCDIQFLGGYGMNVSGVGTKLIINHTIIRNSICSDELWKGITATGSPTKPHTLNYQPKVHIYGGSTIMGAEVAIKSLKGAIIYANDANFIQNNYGIWFDAYSPQVINVNTSASRIQHCNFETIHENLYLQNFNFKEFIHLNNFPSMKIWHNTFSNSNYELGIAQRGTGISSSGLDYLELEYGNTFNRLTNAVRVNSGSSVWIQNNDFYNNYHGISVASVFISSTIRKNDFDDAYLMPTNNAFQVLSVGCYQPNIAHNSFNNGVVGVHLAKSNYGDFQIYKNTFTGFKLYSNANLNGHPTAIHNNAYNGTLGFNPTGAEFKCNTFLDYDYAIAIMGGRVKGEQGSNALLPDAPAGNYFLDDENLMDGVFYVSESAKNNMGTNNYRYYYHTDPTPLNRYDLGDIFRYTEPIAGIKGIDKQVVPVVFDDNPTTGSCPNQSMLPPAMLILDGKVNAVNMLKSNVSTKKDILENKLDLGNTELLLSNIIMANDANYSSLVQEIEEIDSYLSDATVKEFMDKPTNRPVAKAIGLIANSPLPSKAKGKIADLDMDENLKGYIMAQQNGLSKREKAEKEIHQLKLQKYKLLREAVQMAHKDSIGNIYSGVIDLLLEQDEWKQKEMAYRMLKNSPRKDEAEYVFLELQQDLTKFDEQKQYHMEDYLNLLELETRLDTLSDSLRVVSISTKQDLLETIKASDYTEGRVTAEMLLVEAGLQEKEELFIQLPNPEESDNRSANSNYKKEANSFNFANTPDLIEVYPNPVDDRLTVEYIMFNGLLANAISIYDINGKLMLTQSITKSMDIIDINVSQLLAGTYIITFGKDGTSSNSTKFIVK